VFGQADCGGLCQKKKGLVSIQAFRRIAVPTYRDKVQQLRQNV
jgi:hypothetical protein